MSEQYKGLIHYEQGTMPFTMLREWAGLPENGQADEGGAT